jgi:hypothetical protein
MPFTPFHFGPGAALKAVLGKRFSFTVFCFAQVATDCETAYYMLQGEYPWHRFCHTYVGATLVGGLSMVVGRPICQVALRILRHWAELETTSVTPVAISLGSAATGAFIGTYSHVVLDSIMHEGVAPFMPFSHANPLYQMMSSSALHGWCAGLGFFGMLYAAIAYHRATSASNRSTS